MITYTHTHTLIINWLDHNFQLTNKQQKNDAKQNISEHTHTHKHRKKATVQLWIMKQKKNPFHNL